MKITYSNSPIKDISQQLMVAFLFEDADTKSFSALKDSQSALIESLVDNKTIKSDLGSVTPLIGHTGLPAAHVVVIGCGKAENFKEAEIIKTMASVTAAIKSSSAKSLALCVDDITTSSRDAVWCAGKCTETILTGLYEYDTTKSKKADSTTLEEIHFITEATELDQTIVNAKAIAHGTNIARELGNLPANICDPDYLAAQATNLADAYDEVEVEILEEAQLEEMGMGAFMAVSRGSEKGGKILVMKYNGGPAGEKPHVLVGKGLTFDSGGYSLKPPAGMEEMKWDMLGAASVIGTMNTIAELKPNMNVIGVVATAENMISGGATRPGDVVTCMNGKTVEIINTDAEGRLVLCDTLTYVERFEPKSVVDIATLTGAIVIGLGHHATGVYANDEVLQQELVSAGIASWDRGWAMPLWDDYKDQLKSPYADMRNVGTRAGGSITAAVFLSEYAKNYKWAHLDIAGTGWSSAKEGASGRPVAMLTQYLLNQ
ncbi:leucyl aminopeptidase [Reinekea marina]|uniref:Probable cytosol aminopeptidase n=1 Tax=Reinekea marina TaxID=1310421 RepID=A0ABV7WLY2_9GAMM|nr:leucyl aminopeptidase [Reinekea marina]MDN3649930.1 leucyl aminopeptidase [Reinekea marina]